MTEREIVKKFYTSGLNNLFGNYKLYHIEFPLRRIDEKPFFIDLVLKDFDNNRFICFEFKKDKILHSALDQLKIYSNMFKKQMYNDKVKSILVSCSGISNEELTMCKKEKISCLLFDPTTDKIKMVA